MRSGYTIQSPQQLFPGLNGGSGSYNPTVLWKLWLPNSDGSGQHHQFYQFFYNSYGELARLELPTGGATEYDMTPGSGIIGTEPWEVYRRLVERRVYADGSTLESRTTYDVVQSSWLDAWPWTTMVTVNQMNPSSQLLARSKHYFNGSGLASLIKDTPAKRKHIYAAWNDGQEYQTEVFAADGTTVLRRVANTFQQRATVSWWAAWTLDGGPEPACDPRLTETVSTLVDTNQVSKQTFSYDQYNNQTDIYEYDYGSGAPGALVRRAHTDYLTTNPVNSTDYTATNIHMRSLPTQTSVYDAGGTERARTTFEYDNYATDTNHAALGNRAGISGFDASFSTSYTTRGNATATSHYLLVNGLVTGSITGYAQYDIAGNVVVAIDARGNPTTITYDDCFGSADGNARLNAAPLELSSVGQISFAFPTVVTKAGQTTYAQFDYYLGRPVEGEDVNGVVASGYYSDLLDRPTKVIRAFNTSAQNQTVFAYDDAGRTITTSSDLNTNFDGALVSKVIYDGLGRTVEGRQYEGGTNYIAVQTQYDALGRAFKVSNPFRPWQSESAIWTTTAFDALGRVLTVTTPDSAVVASSYSGNTVTVTDQTGKARKSLTDGVGRLAQVYEDPSGLNYLTSYSYDPLDNLTGVSQGSQTRTFVYDSLKRLSSATNPESGTVSYSYDNNGNLTSKLDARNITTTFAYDALNRVTSKSYNDSPQTPTVSYFYDSQSLPGGAPSFSRGYATGRLVALTYGSGSSAGDYYGYDAAGHTLLKIQQTGGINYQTSASYNLAGAPRDETYPSVRTVSYTYDTAGRTNAFSGNLGDGVNRTYATAILYSPLGGMTKEQFGTDTAIYNKLFYNSRGQLAEIRESTSYTGATDTTWNRGAIINHYSNGCWGMCGGSNSTTPMTEDNCNLKKQEVYIPSDDQVSSYTTWWQGYDYDSLNRLQRVHELTGNPATEWQQEYVYDAQGNRTIHQTNSWGAGAPKPNFGVATATNRLTPPAGYTMSYDAAGNLSNDTYTGAGSRSYDAENRMTQAWANGQWQYYTYDGDGQRVRRNVNGVESWQVYGMGGELLAEYAANAAAASAQKEYGYRNGQLLVSATVPLTVGSGLQGQYFDNLNFTDLKVTRSDATVDFDWGGGTPDAAIGVDTFSVRWQGKVEPQYSQSYTFYTQTDDGVRLWVNGQLVIDKWIDQGPTEWSGQLTLTAGQRYDIVMEFYENGGGAMARLSWSSASQAKQIIPQSRLYPPGSSSQVAIEWLVTDQLGTPRMVFDKSGSLANTKRHDYLPFGEELFAGTGGRTPQQGYGAGDGVRQHFTQKERDIETGLDYFGARYYSSTQGRFTTGDPASLELRHLVNPQDLNRYAYVANNPLKFIDPDGEEKIQVIIQTFIPQKSVTVPVSGRTFEGDNRSAGDPGGFRTQQIINIETDPSKGGPQVGPINRDTGITNELSGPGGRLIGQSQASGETLQGAVTRDESGVNVRVSGNESNPRITSPGITYGFNINVQSAGTQGNVTVTVTGSHDKFPGYEILVTRPEVSKPSTTLVYQHDPSKTGNTGLSLFPGNQKTINPAVRTVIPPPPPPPPPPKRKREDE